MSKQNYRHVKKQKENARKARHAEKQQRRQTRTHAADPASDGTQLGTTEAPDIGRDSTEKDQE